LPSQNFQKGPKGASEEKREPDSLVVATEPKKGATCPNSLVGSHIRKLAGGGGLVS